MRLDGFLVKIGKFNSRNKAQESIKKGEIFVNGSLTIKSAYDVSENDHIEIKRVSSEFVSVGGYKLEKAFNDFNFSPRGQIVADIGASTGGFTDCVLKNGAKKVYAVDLNDDLLADNLKKDNRVVRIIKNARLLEKDDFYDKIDLIVADLSFISATMVMDVFSNLLDCGKNVILLIKPQFEVGEKRHFKNGIVMDTSIREKICVKILDCARENSLFPYAITTAPIIKGKNVEYLIWLKKDQESKFNLDGFNF